MPKDSFQFKQFMIRQDRCAMKVGTDGTLLGAWVNVTGAKTILDIGTGTGMVALMLAQRNPEAVIKAVELDTEACSQAVENVRESPWAGRVEVLQADIRNYRPEIPNGFDLIVCNPPFFQKGMRPGEQGREKARHGIALSLSELLTSVELLLGPRGCFACVLPPEEAKQMLEIALEKGLFAAEILEVFSRAGRPLLRLLIQFRREKSENIPQRLVIHDGPGNEYTPAFQQLTAPFYLEK